MSSFSSFYLDAPTVSTFEPIHWDPNTQRAKRTGGAPENQRKKKRAYTEITDPDELTNYQKRLRVVNERRLNPYLSNIQQETLPEKIQRWLPKNQPPAPANVSGAPEDRCRKNCRLYCLKRARELKELTQEKRQWKEKSKRVMKLLRAEEWVRETMEGHHWEGLLPEFEEIKAYWSTKGYRYIVNAVDTTMSKSVNYVDGPCFGFPKRKTKKEEEEEKN